MSLTISIDRTSLTLADLVLGAQDGTGGLLGVTDYQEPAQQSRVSYAPASSIVHGETSTGWAWQHTLLNFEVAPFDPADEQASRDAIAELAAALTQFPRFEVTVTVGDADAETWLCDPGSIVPTGSRTYVDLRDHDPAWRVSIPCYPIRGVA